MTACRVVVEETSPHAINGRQYHVRVDLDVSGEELVVGQDSVERVGRSDVYASIDDAFDCAHRAVREWALRRSGERQRVAAFLSGNVTRIFQFEGFGFLSGADGVEVYFHRNAVLRGAFELLERGAEVRFALQDGHEPRASTVEASGVQSRARARGA